MAVTLERGPDGGDRLHLEAGTERDAEVEATLKRIVAKLAGNRGRLRAWPLGFLRHHTAPGRGFHGGGTFPMRQRPGAFESDGLGRPSGFDPGSRGGCRSVPSKPTATHDHLFGDGQCPPDRLPCPRRLTLRRGGPTRLRGHRCRRLRRIEAGAPLAGRRDGGRGRFAGPPAPAPGRSGCKDRPDAAVFEARCARSTGPTISRRGAGTRSRAINVEGTRRWWECAAGAGVRRFVLISSLADAFAGCRSLYGRAKLATEAVAAGHGAVIVPAGTGLRRPAGGHAARALDRLAAFPVAIPMVGAGSAIQYVAHEDDLRGPEWPGRWPSRMTAGRPPLLAAHPAGYPPPRDLLRALAPAARGRAPQFVPIPRRIDFQGAFPVGIRGIAPGAPPGQPGWTAPSGPCARFHPPLARPRP